MKNQRKSILMLAVKLTVVALCLAIIARKVDLSEIADAWRALRWPWIVLAALALWMEPVVAAVKWRLLIAAATPDACPPFWLTVKVVFTANFLSLLAPTAMSADGLRLWMMRRRSYPVARTASAMIADRALGLGTLLLLSLAGWSFARAYLPDSARRLLPLVCVGGLLAIVAAFLPQWQRLFPPCQAPDDAPIPVPVAEGREERMPEEDGDIPPRSETESIEDGPIHPGLFRAWRPAARFRALAYAGYGMAGKLVHGFQGYRRHPGPMALAGLWNLVIQGMRVLQVFLLFRGLNYPVALVDTLTFVPMIVILSMIPISFYGAGVKEGAFIVLFSRVGVPESVSLSVSLLTYPLILSALLPGLVFFLADRKE
jgi:glycosyltransferase 2 family protein